MKILFLLIMMISNESPISNHLPEINNNTNISKSEITKTAFARVYYNSLSSETEGTKLNLLLHEFNCSTPKWKKDLPITACEISKDIELVFYERKNYKGDHMTFRSQNNADLLQIPKKFSLPGSVKVLYKGDKDCISSINGDAKNALEYVSVEDQIEEPNETFNIIVYGIQIYNRHESKSISVRYRLYGRNQNINTVKVKPNEKKHITRYHSSSPRNVTILDAKFINK